MKKVIILFASVVCLASCKKCYKCTTTVDYTDNTGSGSTYPSSSSNSEVCGTPKDKEAAEDAGTATTTVSMMGVSMSAKTVTSCAAK